MAVSRERRGVRNERTPARVKMGERQARRALDREELYDPAPRSLPTCWVMRESGRNIDQLSLSASLYFSLSTAARPQDNAKTATKRVRNPRFTARRVSSSNRGSSLHSA